MITQPSANFYAMQASNLQMNSTGSFAGCFQPTHFAAFGLVGFQNTASVTGAAITWNPGTAAPNYASVYTAFSSYRVVSAGLMFVPAASITVTAATTYVGVVPSPAGAQTLNTMYGSTTDLQAGYGMAPLPSSDSWVALWRPKDFQSLDYKNVSDVNLDGENMFVVTASGNANQYYGKLVFFVNFEGIPMPTAAGIIMPTESHSDLRQMEEAANKTASLNFLSNVAFYSAAWAPGGGGNNAAGRQVSNQAPSALRSAVDAAWNAVSSAGSTVMNAPSTARLATQALRAIVGHMVTNYADSRRTVGHRQRLTITEL